MKINRICVFCGSSSGNDGQYTAAAELLGDVLIKNNIGLVYGGAKIGLMGKIASKLFDAGKEVIGVIPKSLVDKEVAFTDLSDLKIVDSMHERKAMMAELSDGFIAMPGGFGTFEEIFEVITWGQLNFHNKPCGLLNIKGYYNHLLAFLNHSVTEHFIYQEHRDMVLVDDNPEKLIEKFYNYSPPLIDKAAKARQK